MTQPATTAAAFLALLAPATQPVKLTSGNTVWVREVPAGEAEALAALLDAAQTERARQHLVAAVYLCNEAGEPMLQPGSDAASAALGRLGFANLRRILKAGDVLNGYAEDPEKKS